MAKQKATSATPQTYGYMDVGACRVDLREKNACVNYYVKRWLTEAQSMLRFEGLPDTIPERELIRLLQINGFAILPDPQLLPDGKPYAFFGGLGGERDPYYMPTVAIVSNPALNLSANYEIHKEAVVVWHDSYLTGLIPLFNHYATQVVETDLSIYLATILARAPVHISAQGDRSKASADQYLKELEKGNLGAIFESGFLDGIKATPGSASQSNQSITNLIELRQYLKASRWNDIGLNSNYNMKRESINEAEAQMNNDALTPIIDDIIRSIQTGLDEYNGLFGYNIQVHLNGAWEIKERTTEATVEAVEAAVEEPTEGGPEDAPGNADPTPESV